MIREHLFSKRAPTDPKFRWRGGDISRLEGLSDGVFAVTITLLVVSTAVPRTYYELWMTIRDLPVFFSCFAVLMMTWRYHYIFFRRYGLEDFLTSVLNGAFLFVIMFYAYPLKFLASFLWRLILGDSTAFMFQVPEGIVNAPVFQRAGMMYFYGLGVIGVFGLLALMVFRAYCLRDQLDLDQVERFLTVTSIRSLLLTVGIAILSVIVLALTSNPGISGVIYFLMGPAHALLGIYSGRRSAAIMKEMNLPPEANPGEV